LMGVLSRDEATVHNVGLMMAGQKQVAVPA
jgi:hypothetical protein